MNSLVRSLKPISRITVPQAFRALSTVAENTIQVTFVDKEGNRAKLPCLIGKTLLECAQIHKIELDGQCKGGGGPREVVRTPRWTETTFGIGPTCYMCHVQIPPQFKHLMPHIDTATHENLALTWEEEYQPKISTLACQITLTREHDGLIVLVPDPLESTFY